MSQICKGIIANQRGRGKVSYCPTCEHYCHTDPERKCDCCLRYVPIAKRKDIKELKKFDKVIDDTNLLSLVKEWGVYPHDIPLGVPMKLGYYNYFVTIDWFMKYLELAHIHGENKEELFLRDVKRNCQVLPKFGWTCV